MNGETTIPSGRGPVPSGYQLLKKIGEGGTGEVFLARQLSLDRQVAIKVLRDAQVSRQWLLEPRLMGSLSHPNVVTVYDCVRSEGGAFLVLKYVDGVSLRELMVPDEPWPVDRVLRVLDAVSDALRFIHSRSLLHLDLKPENVLCSRDLTTVKIADFGLAQHCGAGESMLPLMHAEGSPDYSAPEQRFGLRVDARTDLFSLGTIVYELLTGRLPGRVYVSCAYRNPRLSVVLDDVLRPALARDIEDRPASVDEFRNALIGLFARRRYGDGVRPQTGSD